ncbi:MAG: cell division protein ZapA [Fibromonadaceae bacterium]|nr:cell division protein ZapA [Fibromonadaceae bacterium]
MSNKIRRQVIIARTPVHVSTPLSEEMLQSVVTYVEEKFQIHEKAAGNRSDDDRKADTLIITLLDIAAELLFARQEIKRLKVSDTEAIAAIDNLTKKLDEFS